MPGQCRRVRSYGPPIKLRYAELSWQKAGGSENVLRPVRKQSNRGERTFKVKNSIGPGVNCGQHIHRSDDQGGRNVRGSLNVAGKYVISGTLMTEYEWIKQTGATVIEGEATVRHRTIFA